jgi:hypothetical membrane protein
MSDDAKLKLIFTGGMVSLYGITLATQKLDTATLSTLLSGFTNALIGVFAYNWVKSRKEGEMKENA